MDVNQIYIDIDPGESRVAVIDDGSLAEIYIERQDDMRLLGNIYMGRVENVLPGMQAAFVDIGLEKNAFLYVKDAVDYEAMKRGVSIGSVLKSGDEILVQVSKEPSGTKGPRVTSHITLPGKYIVLMPGVEYIGVSRRIEDESERERLKYIISKLKPDGMGVIIRTEAEGREEEDFTEDIRLLTALWSGISGEAKMGGAPRLVHKDMDILYRSIRDLLNRNTTKVFINDRDAFLKAEGIAGSYSPDLKGLIEYYDGSVNMLDFYGISGKIKKALSRKVWLKNGGYIVIDQTEALTSIDVNTGKYTGSHDLKETILKTNLEAAGEIAKQLRLRDIGGIIVIDFIDMEVERHRARVIDRLKDEMKKDRAKSSVFGITHLGLVEMTRKKTGKRLNMILQKDCPMCNGSGRVLDEESIVKNLEREIDRIIKEHDAEAVTVEVNDDIAGYLEEHRSRYIMHMEQDLNKRIYIKGSSNIDYDDYVVKGYGRDEQVRDLIDDFEVGDRVEVDAVRSKYLDANRRHSLFSGRVEQIIYGDDRKKRKVLIDISD